MWVLELDVEVSSTLRPLRYGLVPGKTYTVGRALGSHIRGQNDSSISKNHAKLVIMSRGGQDRPEVLVDDLGSKFGTHLNEGLLSEEEQKQRGSKTIIRALKKTVKLQENDRIRFGVMFSVFRLKWEVLNVCTSMMKDKTSLLKWMQEIQPGAKIQPSLNKSTTHLCMSTISLSMKVVNALALSIPLILSSYFRDFQNSLTSQQALPLVSEYIPTVTTSDAESQLRDPTINFGVNNKRSEIFMGKVFVFENLKQKCDNEDAVQNAGGKSVLADGKSVTEDTIDDNYVLIQPAQTTKEQTKEFAKLVAVFKTRDWQVSLQNHIYLAVVHCSVNTFCNPNRSNVAKQTKAFPVKLPSPLKAGQKERAPETQDVDAGDTMVTADFFSGTTRVLETPASGSGTKSNTASSSRPGTSSNISKFLETPASNTTKVLETPSPAVAARSRVVGTFKVPKTDTLLLDNEDFESSTVDALDGSVLSTKSSKNTKRWNDSVAKKRGRENDDNDDEFTPLSKKPSQTMNIMAFDDEDEETLTQVIKTVEKSQKENRDNNSLATLEDSGDALFEFSSSSKTATKTANGTQKIDSQINDSKKITKVDKKDEFDDDEDDMFGFATAPKSRINSQSQIITKETKANNENQTNTLSEDDDEIFGVVSSKKSTKTQEIKKNLKVSTIQESDDLFDFDSSKKTQKSTKTQEEIKKNVKASTIQESDDLFDFESTKSSKASLANKKRIMESVDIDSPAKRPKLTQTQEPSATIGDHFKTPKVKDEVVPKELKDNSKVDQSNVSVISTSSGFIGKGNTTIKSEVKQEGDLGELSRSLCKMTVMGLMRPTTPKPVYVPDASKLGRPVKNFKRFKKQNVDKVERRINLVKYSPSEQSSGIEQWFHQNKDVSRRIEEQDEQEKQSQDFWNFNNQQNSKTQAKIGNRGRILAPPRR